MSLWEIDFIARIPKHHGFTKDSTARTLKHQAIGLDASCSSVLNRRLALGLRSCLLRRCDWAPTPVPLSKRRDDRSPSARGVLWASKSSARIKTDPLSALFSRRMGPSVGFDAKDVTSQTFAKQNRSKLHPAVVEEPYSLSYRYPSRVL